MKVVHVVNRIDCKCQALLVSGFHGKFIPIADNGRAACEAHINRVIQYHYDACWCTLHCHLTPCYTSCTTDETERNNGHHHNFKCTGLSWDPIFKLFMYLKSGCKWNQITIFTWHYCRAAMICATLWADWMCRIKIKGNRNFTNELITYLWNGPLWRNDYHHAFKTTCPEFWSCYFSQILE